MKIKKYIIELPTFNNSGIDVWIGDIGKSAKEAEREYDGLEIRNRVSDGCTAYTCVITHEEHGEFVLMLLPAGASFIDICHESLHAAWFFLEVAGVKVTPKNHEVLAYLHGYIADSVRTIISKT